MLILSTPHEVKLTFVSILYGKDKDTEGSDVCGSGITRENCGKSGYHDFEKAVLNYSPFNPF